MPDLRPVGYIIGLLTAVLGVAMLIPMAVDLHAGQPNAWNFLSSAVLTALSGAVIALACAGGKHQGLTLRQSFMLATGTWIALPAFGMLPFILGAPGVGVTDAFFESMSGMTTTGTTVFLALEDLPPGTLLWRSLLQWLGGLGIVIVALIFLPVMKVGGMQHFRSEGFDTLGKVLPRALDISRGLVQVYVGLTALCAMVYVMAGMDGFQALNHALTTIATGGFSTADASFAQFGAGAQYVAIVFMILSGLPFVRFVQLVGGSFAPLWQDVQVRAYVRWSGYAIGAIVLYRLWHEGGGLEVTLRETAFNVVSLFSGTGYGTADPSAWGAFPLLVVVLAGLTGACTASTGCSLKVFRYLVLFEAIKTQLRRIHSPNRVIPVRLGGRPLGEDVINSVIALFALFLFTFGVTAVLLSLTGLEMRTAITAAWTAICNIGPAFGPEVGPTGAVDGFPVAAKWIMIVAMLLGRLELISVLVLMLPRFWRG
ncbi:TrkH family potassium uptake protein [Rhodobaculum claviforme]|uniref:Trk system potassium uptake protein n=1 Tax=Rhodobaculum claviforme TaxID=1549854 RepID=A0A934WI56_9RHOB|nr:TrkH family potassium uptake protein [Rhodobaculum claviforme]MBK5926402.1 potassium transporter TrkH [Rhodobaculum claviforme]